MARTKNLSGGTYKTSLILPQELKRDGDAVAAIDGVTFTTLVEQALTEYLSTRQEEIKQYYDALESIRKSQKGE